MATAAGAAIEDMRTDNPFALYKRVGAALALAIAFVSLAEFYWNAVAPTDRDFVSFWGAARMVLAGTPALAYDLDALHALQSGSVTFSGGKMPFPYAPAFLLPLAPFALLSFPVGMAAWVATTFAIYFTVARRMYPNAGLLAAAYPAVFVNAAIGQNGFIMAALFIGGLLLLPKRPFAAGLLLGCLIVKPQLGLMLPVALLAAREWRAIVGAAVSSIGVLLLGLLLFGWQASSAWLAQMPLYVSIARDGLVGWHKLATVYAAVRQLGVPETAAFAAHLTVAAAATFAVWRTWRSDAPFGAKAAMLAAATMLISPYLFLYDTLFLVVPFLWLASARANRALLIALWFLPFVSIVQIATVPGLLNLAPIVPIALTLLVWRHARSGLESRHRTV